MTKDIHEEYHDEATPISETITHVYYKMTLSNKKKKICKAGGIYSSRLSSL